MSNLQGGAGSAGTLPFIYGHVDPTLFPVEKLAEASAVALKRYGRSALNYGASLGCAPLRDYLRAKIASDERLEIGPGELMITASASAGLDAAVRVFSRPGDTVLVEAPSYHEALATIRDNWVKLAAVPVDAEGLKTDALEARLMALVRAGERPTILYTIPTFQNPSGTTMSKDRRHKVLDLARRFNFLVVEDDVYRDLYFESLPPPSLQALDTEGVVIRLGSFSKILAPGLRLGWAIGSVGNIDRMANCGLAQSGGGANPFSSFVVASFVMQGWLEPHIDHLRQVYRERRDTLLDALDSHMPTAVDWSRPSGGFFVWLSLPAPLTAGGVLERAKLEEINFLTGEPFFAEGGGERQIRLPFSYIPQPDLTRGIETLSAIVREMLGA
jgi:DNA-binding transcriptional MocR family regulator